MTSRTAARSQLRVTPIPGLQLYPAGIPQPRHLRLPPEVSPDYYQEAFDLELFPDELLFGPQPTRSRDLPDPAGYARIVAQGLVEVMSGQRAAAQLIRHCTPEVYAVLAHRALAAQRRRPRGVRPAPRPLVRRVVVCEPADGVAEVSVVIIDGSRIRALALRLEGRDGRWQVSVLQMG